MMGKNGGNQPWIWTAHVYATRAFIFPTHWRKKEVQMGTQTARIIIHGPNLEFRHLSGSTQRLQKGRIYFRGTLFSSGFAEITFSP